MSSLRELMAKKKEQKLKEAEEALAQENMLAKNKLAFIGMRNSASSFAQQMAGTEKPYLPPENQHLYKLTPEQINTAAIQDVNLSPKLIIDPTIESTNKEILESVLEPKSEPTASKLPTLSLAERLAQLKQDHELLAATNTKLNTELELTLVERLAQLKQANQSREIREITIDLPSTYTLPSTLTVQKGKDEVTYEDLNTNQRKAINIAKEGISFCLIGSAGSGKTTTTRELAYALEASGEITEIGTGTKVLSPDDPSIIFVSFTNQSVSNIREAVPNNYKNNCLTIHKFLEYEPIFFDIWDPVAEEMKPTMRYEPQRNALNPIVGITHIVVEEASSVSLDLFDNLRVAVPPNVIWIFLGDLNQLPPVFGDGILGYKLLELPIVELTQSYRTDSTSPIRLLAYKVLEGKALRDSAVDEMHVDGELELIRFKDRVPWEHGIKQMGQHFRYLVAQEFNKPGTGFNYEKDVVLIPFNKQLGTIEINKYIAQEITELNEVPTHEIIVGFVKEYYAVGDIVYHKKIKCRIVEIKKNVNYVGKTPQPASLELDRWGKTSNVELAEELEAAQALMTGDEMLEKLAQLNLGTENDISFHQASHVLVLEDMAKILEPFTISDCASINALYFAYALTVHKSQGSEWDKVFCVFHHSHGNMMKREILYTAITRARKFLRVYYSGEDTRAKGIKKVGDSTWHKGILKQEIPGNDLESKLDYFRKKLQSLAIKQEVDRVKNTEGATFTRSNTELDGEAAKKLLYKLTHGADNFND